MSDPITIFVPGVPGDPVARAERETILRAVRAAIGETRVIVATTLPPGYVVAVVHRP